MADNYLERKMEEHRMARMGVRRPKKLSPSGQRPGKLTVDYPPLRVYVRDGGPQELAEAIIKAFRNAACRVAFCGLERVRGTQIAQRYGAQYHPISAADKANLDRSLQRVIDGWGDIDVEVSFAAGRVELRMHNGVSNIQIGDHPEEQVAAMCVFLAGPKSGAWTVG